MLQKITIAPLKNITPKDGIVDSKDLNSAIGSLITSVGVVSQQWNSTLTDLLNTLPGGGRTVLVSERSGTPNAFQNGIDGANIFIDSAATSKIENGEYFKSNSNRAYTVKEYITKVKIDTNIRLAKLESSITLLQSLDSTGLTQAQKEAIGLRIFDNTQTSLPTSMDGKISTLIQNVQQILCDVFNGRDRTPPHTHLSGSSLHALDYALTGGSVQSLGITVFEWINAIAYATGHSVDVTSGKPVITHTPVTDVLQQWVRSTVNTGPGPSDLTDDTFVAAPTTLVDDLNRIRQEIKEAKGTATWETSIVANLGGSIVDLNDLLTYSSGGGVKTASNPFGFDISNITDTSGLLALPSLTSGEAINAGQFVSIDTSGQVFVANKTSSARSFVIGVAYDTVAGAALAVRVRTGSFKLSGLVGLTPGTIYYLNNTGGLTSTATSTSGEFIVRLGVAVSATELLVKISDEVRVA